MGTAELAKCGTDDLLSPGATAGYENHKGLGAVATPDGVWHRDSHYRRNLIGWGTQDTDLR